MKKITKIILKILNFVLVFMLMSCEKDLYEDSIYQSKFTVENVSLKNQKSKVIIDENLFKAVNKISNSKQNTNGKIVFDSINNIYFDDDSGIKITKDDYESYTFKIIKEGGKLENLLFSKNEMQEFDVYKVKYDFTEEEINNLTEQQIENSPKDFLQIVTDDNGQTQMFAKCMGYIDCIIHVSPRDFDPNSFYAIEICSYRIEGCADGGGGSSSGVGSSSGSSGTGSSNSGSGTSSNGGGSNGASGDLGSSPNSNNNNNSQIITTPLHGAPLVTTPCNKVKKQFLKFPSLRQSLVDFSSTTSQNAENGIFIDNSSSNSTPNPIQNVTSGTNGVLNFNTNPTNPYLMFAHTHNNPATATFSVPSFEDMRTLAHLGTAGHLDDNFVFYTITADGTRYAITIEDPQSFTDFFPNPLAHPNEDIDWVSANNYLKIARKYYLFDDDDPSYRPLILEINTDNQTDLKKFLSFLKEANLGATVFKVSPDFNTFTKATLSSNNNTIQYDDCN